MLPVATGLGLETTSRPGRRRTAWIHGPPPAPLETSPPGRGAATDRSLWIVVVTGDEPLRVRLHAVAVAHGATCRTPTTVAQARWAARARPGLAFIDIDRPLAGRRPEARALVEELAQDSAALVAVCGSPVADGASHAGAGDDERWARQLGVFVYLPGVGGDAGVGLIIDAARRIL